MKDVRPHASPLPDWRHSWCSEDCPHHPRVVLDAPTPSLLFGFVPREVARGPIKIPVRGGYVELPAIED